ncbi:hypothetical protein [Modestobacter versicolor]|uniref:hypothetical protein n=1 Tax=Modestobacter versicolor TaxID=429133 RepID=UPI0034E024F9
MLLLVWLVIGAVAAGQRGYFSDGSEASCATAVTVVVTVLAGPLNYVGVNPQVDCDLPQPSQ